MENKLDLILIELQKIFKQIDEKFEQIDKRLDGIDVRLDGIDERLDGIDRRITIIDETNKDEHRKMLDMLNSLNSAFLRFEAEQTDKIRILFDADQDRRDHQNIYAHEFTRLNDLVAKNSFRISNLEQHQ